MVVARALDDRALADELRESAMAIALELGGWKDPCMARATLEAQFAGPGLEI
jgi:hypothetical protein